MLDAGDKAQPVTLDLYTLEMWGLKGSGYCVRLDGDVDDIWADSFIQAQHTKGDATRFYLDRKRCVLVFSTAIGEDPQKLPFTFDSSRCWNDPKRRRRCLRQNVTCRRTVRRLLIRRFHETGSGHFRGSRAVSRRRRAG